ncbi:DEAD/DEAH box helicase [Chryseomicrobium sp. FSL W7-1435]|uniref:DEAD/DEAH box helicase n=1 Tax=Chryseomicrobium sp. FSL W7-1435 TaxID=2921704 RepID=UPI00315B13E7
MSYSDAQLKQSLEKGFINHQIAAHDTLKPQLLLNQTSGGEAVLTTLLEDLQICKSFFFSVAFITESGLATLKAALHDLHLKGISGKILTSTFLEFNKPKVFEELLKLPNVEVRLTSLKGFHAKGYIFEHAHTYSMIVGSSNLTANALKVNYEWNVRLTSNENGDLIRHFVHQFKDVWDSAAPLSTEWIQRYTERYVETVERQKLLTAIEPDEKIYRTNPLEVAVQIEPNKMQTRALESLASMRQQENRALVVSATGTGKTYLSAFDVRAAAPKRMLFIVHREQILKQAKADFMRVLGAHDEQFGFLTGSEKNTDAKYVFATVQTLSKPNVFSQIAKDHFDYIIIDEVHRAGAESYQRVIDYFRPDFLLGMTATPERTDAWNIFELFQYNVAYEIRLQEALEEDLLSTFHYFGVTDIELDGLLLDENVSFSSLVSDLRINHIVEKITYYGYAGDSVRGLMFCSRIEEAKEISEQLNLRGYRTKALAGSDSMEQRLETVDELENGHLDYIITVDIFNEGIDIPSINQVVMLRQTQSSIIFIQQLGRGLRKHPSKDYVTIIDFIGNYKNNYLIPMALSEDSSLNKDTIRRSVADTSYIKGASTVIFEQVAKEQIYRSINTARIDNFKYLKETFLALYNRLGREPDLLDFVENHSIDPVTIMESNAHYDAFVNRIKREKLPFSNYEVGMLTFLSQELLAGKRLHEIVILKDLMSDAQLSKNDVIQLISESNLNANERSINSALRVLDYSFFTSETKRKYMNLPPIELQHGMYALSFTWKKSLTSNPLFAHRVKDILAVAILKSQTFDSANIFTLYKKYSRRDVAKLLNWDEGDHSTMYGYQFKHSSMPIFVNYHKETDTIETLQYGDSFIDDQNFKWYTKVNFRLDSPSIKRFLQAFKDGLRPHLFIKKDNIEGKDLYYIGEVTVDLSSLQQEIMPDKYGELKPVVTMIFKLQQPVEFNLYHYLTHE